ncbi:MAG TPA: hypothetical protein DHV28_08960 [Ignavibacteriales bacterium]|nr:hypothetical protein [Ignavibacteriales bacterium]
MNKVVKTIGLSTLFFVNVQMNEEKVLEMLLCQPGLVHSVFDSCLYGKGKDFDKVVFSSLNGFSLNNELPAKRKIIIGNINILFFINIWF